MFKTKDNNIIFNIIIYLIIILYISYNMKNNVIHCDSESISELYFNNENTTSNTVNPEPQCRFSVEISAISLRQKISRKLYWHLFSKDFMEYDKFKTNWYPSRSLRKQMKVEIKDFIYNPIKYSTHKREWLLVNNCKYYKDNPNGTFFVQGLGYLDARYVHYLTAKYGYIVHNDRFIQVNIKDVGNIIRQIYINP
uniref:Uncharacterized protein n=1 Tax=Beauveria caledonica TaxID=38006 RepID=A0A192S214_9HYPO|nr:hypothetical protein [Beauveria caledonica]AMD61827.1 hypothetical protein [Beauveria caledonica]